MNASKKTVRTRNKISANRHTTHDMGTDLTMKEIIVMMKKRHQGIHDVMERSGALNKYQIPLARRNSSAMAARAPKIAIMSSSMLMARCGGFAYVASFSLITTVHFSTQSLDIGVFECYPL